MSTPGRNALRHDTDTELLRSELFSIEQLKRHAITLAGRHRVDPRRGPDRLLPRLADNERILLAAYDVVAAANKPGQSEQRITPVEAWLLDNFYLIEQQISLTRRYLPRRYSRQLPQLRSGPMAGFPRIYELALELISHQDGRVDADNALNFIVAYQTVQPLKIGELWAFPIMLRLALLENLRRVGLHISNRRLERDDAIMWADRMLSTAENEPRQLTGLLAEFAGLDIPLTAMFVEEFYARIQTQSQAMAFIRTWIEQQLNQQGVTAAQLSQSAGRTEAANQISISNTIGSLRFINSNDWRTFVEGLSVVEQTLREDPSGTHASQEFATRDRYRRMVEDIAKFSPLSEVEVARKAVELAAQAAPGGRTAHVGYYLVDAGRRELEQAVKCRYSLTSGLVRIRTNSRVALYLGTILTLVTLAGAAMLSSPASSGLAGWQWIVLAVAATISASALAVAVTNLMATVLVAPHALPRMDFSQGIPLEHRTMVVVPTLLTGPQEVVDLLEALEIRYLGNRDPNLFFALLTDFRDAPEPTLAGDDILIAQARSGIRSLNETYREDRPCIFYLFHRPRVWNPHERVWMGYERKRGKLEQFNALLRGKANGAFCEKVGDVGLLSSIRYVITLDTDTQLPRDAARTLVGSLAHPLNRPVYDSASQRIVEGYAILQPRASISLTSAGKSHFTRLFAGEAGIDPYTREVSDVYQDLFSEGSFIGKGIYDVDAFRQALDGRFPENLILSHDLLESGYARSALLSDVDLIEDHPLSYVMEASRRHRWIRGDWQLAGWLLPRVPGPDNQRLPNPLTPLSRWKILDNLRRSLVPPSLLGLLAGGWLFGAANAQLWTLLALAVIFLPTLMSTAIDLISKPAERDWTVHIILTSQAAVRPFLLAVLTLVFLPYDAFICLSAIFQSSMRMLFTRKGLLIWYLPSYATRNGRSSLPQFFLEMWVAPVLAATLSWLLWTIRPAEWLAWAPILTIWLLAPAVGWWISTPLRKPSPDLTADQQIFLRGLARRTWRFFDEFVCQRDNWLPPDNFQEYPAPVIATRTSPTNIGMAMLANLTASDFGYLAPGEFLRRTGNMLTSLEKLERYRGHFYNWYDTRTLQPLHPQYVSSVDSGNLIGCLLTLQAGLAELRHQPILPVSVFQGLADTLRVLAEHTAPTNRADLLKKMRFLRETLDAAMSDEKPQTLAGAHALLEGARRLGVDLAAALAGQTDSELPYWIEAFDHQCRVWLEDPVCQSASRQSRHDMPVLAQLAGEGNAESGIAMERIDLIDDLIERCRDMAQMDFEFLYDHSCGLLAIGYDVGERHRDPACYDLLASEARLASFLLIAQGQVPQKHWFTLGRLLTSHGSDVSLISWSGSMFEYLMPQLIMPSYENTLLAQTCQAAVSRQIEYGRQRGVPWGISESCYNTTDLHHTYQYRAFGVPGMGFKQGLADDLVIAPYATALALTVSPREACRNLQALAAEGFLGMYGLYEAIDYTPSRVQRGKNHAIVRTFMAHHQGMSLLALGHVLLDRPMQRRFMSDPLVRTTELLLQERVPKKGATLHPHAAEVSAAAQPLIAEEGTTMRVFSDPNTPIPEVHLLSNGSYHVMATNSGGGYSCWRELAISRWREDATCDNWGTFIYLRDRDTGRYWSAAYQPTLRRAEHYQAIFVQGRAEYRRRDHAIETHTEISVSPEDDVEIRRITLTNLSPGTRRIEITSYMEVVLAPLNADLAHRAFSNLFVQTEILPELQAIFATRRRRTPNDKLPWMFHLLTTPGMELEATSYETDRARFIGRGRTPAEPAALQRDASPELSNTAGPVLDPIMAIRRLITLAPDQSVTIHFIYGVAETRESALALLGKYCDRHFIERAFEMAWFQSQEVLRHINATEIDAQVYGRLATSVIHANGLRRAAPGIIARNHLGQSGLWRFAISGDLPIVLVRISDQRRIDLVKQILQAHAYWRMKGLSSDLVILNEDFSGYRAILQDRIIGLINAGSEALFIDKPGGVFVRRAEELSEEDRVLFLTVARVVLNDSIETLAEQVERRMPSERMPDRRRKWRVGSKQRRMPAEMLPSRLEPTRLPIDEPARPLTARDCIFGNGLGGFTRDGREYVIALEPGQITPAPWVNVIASPFIGTVVSESGGAYTWVGNAHEVRLTPFHNDPISDISGEALYVRDEETGEFWSPSPLPATGRFGYVCRHGFGYSVFEHYEAGIYTELSIYVAMDAPVKFAAIKLHNWSGRPRRLSLTGYWELVMGEWRHANLMHIVTETDPENGALLVRNAYGRECAHRVAFVQVSEAMRTVTGNRAEFIGRNGSLADPAAMRRIRLSGKTGAGLDPCAAMQTQIELGEGQEHEVVFAIGLAKDNEEAQYYSRRFGGTGGARQALEGVWGYWNHTLGAVNVETPDPALDVLANGWLVYQTMSCRLWGRSGYYQSGGAYGFRDQLQDTMALVHATPWLAREQLIRCAERQFLQGDVQHWWHPPGGQGVRTHFSDDYLWLPYAASRYVQATGDLGILDEQVHFLEGRDLSPEEEAYYDQPQRSAEVATLYEHCVRAIKHGLQFGEHQLPLMGCGDWNDGMNLVGQHGKGESVWLAWFLYENLSLFADIARGRSDEVFAEICTFQAERLRNNIEDNAWDGSWYRRAYFDDGTPLGSSQNDECRIDSISQSWAVISGGGDPFRARVAMEAVDRHLVRRDAKLIQLLDPPFDKSNLEPGYIKGYVPGVRENGGQYTHAAIWTTTAFALMGDRARAWEFFTLLNPINHGSAPDESARYKVEPYVMCADIYGSPPHTGRGGWTWYTGAAGWMYRLAVETLLGLQLKADKLVLAPRIPDGWTSYRIHYRFRDTMYHISIKCVAEPPERVTRIVLDGVPEPIGAVNAIPLADDRREHHVEVEIGRNAGPA